MDTRYKEIEMSTGYVVKVYPVEQLAIWDATPDWDEPQKPMHTMTTAVGEQQRPAKEGDPEWPEYQRLHDKWEEEQDVIQSNLTLVLALRDFKYPDELLPPPHLVDAIDAGLIAWFQPLDNIIVKKAAWLRAHAVTSGNDWAEVQYAISGLTGTPEELIDAMRNRFRRRLQARLDKGEEMAFGEVDLSVEAG